MNIYDKGGMEYMSSEENEDQVIFLKDEHGEEHEFHVIDFLTEKDNKYVVLQPVLAEEEEDVQTNSEFQDDVEDVEEYEAVIMRIEEQDGEHILVLVEDDDEWERIAKAFEEKQHTTD